ncbi:competence protein [Leptolyngbya sp. 'hensonii']|uniref:ComEC/Rec2 family competence protein n=1 Tax=Leptolyngbya sp. 'hensonii' TaxID=1922337 RepID=UPI00094FC68F|nr:ComEC/Rec2 family competence protein [Leptolyngbya sp. 'hensonii']OLP19494.1 competence protein [Leptolyngbya sp. 'hensonii']
MTPAAGIILCLAYILGLVATVIPQKILGFPAGGIGVLALCLGIGRTVPYFRRRGVSTRLWVFAGVMGLLASLYLTIRIPQPAGNDVLRSISQDGEKPHLVTIRGNILSTARLTRSQKAQFWLQASHLEENPSGGPPGKAVSGKLYVTVPLLQATGLRPGQTIAVTGTLYQPQGATNPGGFNFQAYLAQEGGFTGLKGQQVHLPADRPPRKWSWWAIQQRIIRSQVRWTGSPEGPLISAMVLGSRVVDLPYDIRDQFAQAGLAHALAASGFQVSLILGVLLSLTRRLPVKAQFVIGAGAIGIFVSLTGLQPSVLRAAIMGIAALVALTLQRKIKPLGSLLLAATLLLLFNPLWIWDLGFQFSFLATLGLLITVPVLTQWLDWMPPTLTALIAVPTAAYLWTLPLQLYAFGMISPYTIPINVITTPLIAIISLGGVISAVLAVLWPPIGSAAAGMLYYPTHWLIQIVDSSRQLPGITIAAGTISSLQVCAIYGLILLVWLHSRWQKRWWAAGILAIGLVVIPAVWTQTHLLQATVLATSDQPILVVQDRGKVTLVNSGNETTAGLTVMPFLQQQGINQITWAVAPGQWQQPESGWPKILQRVGVQTFYTESPSNGKAPFQDISRLLQPRSVHQQSLVISRTYQAGANSIKLLSSKPPVLELRILGQTWIYVGNIGKVKAQKDLTQIQPTSPVDVLWWTGKPLPKAFLQAIKAKVAIASANSVDPATVQLLNQTQTSLYWTGRDGALQWTPSQGFKAVLSSTNDVS